MYRESPRAREVGAQVVVVIVFEIFPHCGDDDESDFVTKKKCGVVGSLSAAFLFFCGPQEREDFDGANRRKVPAKESFYDERFFFHRQQQQPPPAPLCDSSSMML